jgi:glutathione synthase/RimK-type ligase-like ATP-grasp enzyme
MSEHGFIEGNLARAMTHAQREDWPTCRHLLEQAIAEQQHERAARLLLWEVCQAMHDPAAAIMHLRTAVRMNPLTSGFCPQPRRRVLAIAVVGDFQANLPVAPLFDASTTELHTLWLDVRAPHVQAPLTLPAVDCAFITIAEDARHAGALHAAETLARSLNVPIINSAARIAATSRAEISRRLQGLPNMIVPAQTLRARENLRTTSPDYPILVRPRFSHAGQDLRRLASPPELERYLSETPGADEFYVAPFIEFRSPDGQWRKYRVIFVDRRPFPFHLAIHDHWAIWYYNSGMANDPAKRREEAKFLSNMEAVFPPTAMDALEAIADRVGLDYFGLDCALMPDGRLLVFEVETGMIVHDTDPADVYPYKKEFVPRIFRAVEGMIDARIEIFQHKQLAIRTLQLQS